MGHKINAADKRGLLYGLGKEISIPPKEIRVKKIGPLAAADEALFDQKHGKTQQSIRLVVECHELVVADMVLYDVKRMDANTINAINKQLKKTRAKMRLKHIAQQGHGYFRMDPQTTGMDLIPPGSRQDTLNGDDDQLHPVKGALRHSGTSRSAVFAQATDEEIDAILVTLSHWMLVVYGIYF